MFLYSFFIWFFIFYGGWIQKSLEKFHELRENTLGIAGFMRDKFGTNDYRILLPSLFMNGTLCHA